MPSPSPQISDAEWEVMKVVWESPGPLTAGEVVQRLEDSTHWRPRTIKTLLARLVQKGAVRAEPAPDAARTFLYRAAVSRDACVRQESRSFLSRVFDGAVTPALLHFLESAKLTRSEIEQLRDVLDREAGAAASNSPKGRGGKERKP
jgi:BlaI family transcriptional regulator, penicillinase repressor